MSIDPGFHKNSLPLPRHEHETSSRFWEALLSTKKAELGDYLEKRAGPYAHILKAESNRTQNQPAAGTDRT